MIVAVPRRMGSEQIRKGNGKGSDLASTGSFWEAGIDIRLRIYTGIAV